GVTRQHFSTVATALLWTLEMGLGPRWTPDVEQAWVAAYTVLVTTMQAAMWFDDEAADESVEVAAERTCCIPHPPRTAARDCCPSFSSSPALWASSRPWRWSSRRFCKSRRF